MNWILNLKTPGHIQEALTYGNEVVRLLREGDQKYRSPALFSMPLIRYGRNEKFYRKNAVRE